MLGPSECVFEVVLRNFSQVSVSHLVREDVDLAMAECSLAVEVLLACEAFWRLVDMSQVVIAELDEAAERIDGGVAVVGRPVDVTLVVCQSYSCRESAR